MGITLAIIEASRPTLLASISSLLLHVLKKHLDHASIV